MDSSSTDGGLFRWRNFFFSALFKGKVCILVEGLAGLVGEFSDEIYSEYKSWNFHFTRCRVIKYTRVHVNSEKVDWAF